MASKLFKEFKDIHNLEDKSRVEVISKEDFLQVINRLEKVDNNMKTKEKKENESIKVEIEKLKFMHC